MKYSLTTAVVAIAFAASGNSVLAQSAPLKLLVGNTKVETISTWEGTNLPRPERIVIRGFDVRPDTITMDNSAAAKLLGPGIVGRLKGETPDTTPTQAADHVSTAFTKTLMKELTKTSIPAASETGAPSATLPDTLLIEGSFTTIDEGNKSKRMIIGFGRGASDVRAHVTVSLYTGTKWVVLKDFNVDSASGKKPGAAATMGFGSAAAGIGSAAASGATGGDNKETVEGDASRMAKAVARQIETVMTARQWVAPVQQDTPQTAQQSPSM
jgi:Domain of unknown function (DUF4410)